MKNEEFSVNQLNCNKRGEEREKSKMSLIEEIQRLVVEMKLKSKNVV